MTLMMPPTNMVVGGSWVAGKWKIPSSQQENASSKLGVKGQIGGLQL